MTLLRAALLCVTLFVPLSAAAQSKMYCCTDPAGRRVCGDPLPQVCFDRGYKELSRGGSVLKEIEAPLTPEQRVKRDAELKAQHDQQAIEAAAKRRDQVLVESYATLSELDKRRDRELSIAESELRVNREREALLMVTRSDLEKKKAAAGKKVPFKIESDLESNAAELTSVRMILTSKQKEFDTLKERFENDRRRYIELTGTVANPPPAKH